MANVIINDTHLTNIADAIREKTGTSDTYKPGEMATAIQAIEAGSGGGEGIPEEALCITGNCDNRFAYGGWDWFIERFGNQITTKDITNLDHMFFTSSKITSIPFILKGKTGVGVSCDNTFAQCHSLISEIKFENISFSKLNNVFGACYKLNKITFENCDFSKIQTGANTLHSGATMFQNCYSLRSIPESVLKEIYNLKLTSKYYIIFMGGFRYCYTLDEIRGLSPQTGALTSNCFDTTFSKCNRLKDFIFDTQDGGIPFVVNWTKQTIDFSEYIGYGQYRTDILNYNSGITADKEVIDDATYQALKNDPDWFTCDIKYSRYNHDSAVNTINSLPDASAYLAAKGGTNTIKFKGASGELTDGGAINTLTDEEIAVAVAKGWTVSLV